jgi:hypothetical protein
MSRFQERRGDSERAELYALGLLESEPVYEKRLVLVPCPNPKTCAVHNLDRVNALIKKSKEKNG